MCGLVLSLSLGFLRISRLFLQIGFHDREQRRCNLIRHSAVFSLGREFIFVSSIRWISIWYPD